MSTPDQRYFEKACQAKKYAAAYYLTNPRVTLIDVGWPIKERDGRYASDRPVVRVHVRQQPRGAVFEAFAEQHPELVIDKTLIPFEVDIVECSYKLDWHWQPTPLSPRAAVINPLRGGISISNEWFYNYGTLGGIVHDRDTGAPMLLSAWHVLAGSPYVSQGLRILQPGYGDGGQLRHTIAHFERDVMDQGMDAAVATLTDSRPWNMEQMGIGPVSGLTMPVLGMRVEKSGRASNVTQGVIDGVEGEYPIRYAGFWHKIQHVQRIVPVLSNGTVSKGGDSGAWWMEQGTGRATALHFAGFDLPETALAMAMPPVLDALNVDLALDTPGTERALPRRRVLVAVP